MTESVQGTTLTTTSGSITDASGNVWTLQNVSDGYYLIAENGNVVPVSGNPSLNINADTLIILAPSNVVETAFDTNTITLSWNPSSQSAGAPIIIFVDGSIPAATSFTGLGTIQHFVHGFAFKGYGVSATLSFTVLKAIATAKLGLSANSTSSITFNVVATALANSYCESGFSSVSGVSGTVLGSSSISLSWLPSSDVIKFLPFQSIAFALSSNVVRTASSFFNIAARGTLSRFISASATDSFFSLQGSGLSDIFLPVRGLGVLEELTAIGIIGDIFYRANLRQNINFSATGVILFSHQFLGLANIDLSVTATVSNIRGIVAHNSIVFSVVATANSLPVLVGRVNFDIIVSFARMEQINAASTTQNINLSVLDAVVKQRNLTHAINSFFILSTIGSLQQITSVIRAKVSVFVLSAIGQAELGDFCQARLQFFVISLAVPVSRFITTEDGFSIAADSTRLLLQTDAQPQPATQNDEASAIGTIVQAIYAQVDQKDLTTGINNIDLISVAEIASNTNASAQNNFDLSVIGDVGGIARGLVNFDLTLKSINRPYLIDETFGLFLCADPELPVVILQADNTLLFHMIQEDLVSLIQNLDLTLAATAFGSKVAYTTQNIDLTNVATLDQFVSAITTSSIDFTGTGDAFQVGLFLGSVHQIDWIVASTLTSSTDVTAVQNIDYNVDAQFLVNHRATAIGSIDLTVSADAFVGHVASTVNNIDYTGTGQADQFNEASGVIVIEFTSSIEAEQVVYVAAVNDVIPIESISQLDQNVSADTNALFMAIDAVGTLVINTSLIQSIANIDLEASVTVHQFNSAVGVGKISITTRGGHLWKVPLVHFESTTVAWWSD